MNDEATFRTGITPEHIVASPIEQERRILGLLEANNALVAEKRALATEITKLRCMIYRLLDMLGRGVSAGYIRAELMGKEDRKPGKPVAEESSCT